jgi:hypothetical protein
MIQMFPMTEMVGYCPDCGSDRPFEQHHADAGGCPDSPDGQCPEWSCTACGTALLVGVAADAGESSRVPGRHDHLRDRVA